MAVSAADKLFIYKTDTQQRADEVSFETPDVFFPPYVRGWSDVLDCRTSPYKDRSIEENCKFALGVHKRFILVASSQINEPPGA
jgi:hypothetical protein